MNMIQELNVQEIDLVSGAGPMTDAVNDARSAVELLPGLYNSAIGAMTDMMCRATSKC